MSASTVVHRPTAVRAFSALVLVLMVSLYPISAQAAEIYRCDGPGGQTFVDSPHRCPNGRARQLSNDPVKVREATPPTRPQGGESWTNPRPGSQVQAPVAAQSPRQPLAPVPVEAPAQRAPSACEKRFAKDATGLRECLREDRRAEVRTLATRRLTAMSRAVAEFIGTPAIKDGEIAIGKTGKPASWCEAFLGDVLALRNIEVVDDESAGGPAWIDSGGAAGRPNLSSAAVVDPDFKMWPVNGATVTQGYVTLRWRKSDLVVLRLVANCVEVEPGTVRCNPVRYTSVYVHDSAVPQACNVTYVGRPYWANWKDSMVPIHVK